MVFLQAAPAARAGCPPAAAASAARQGPAAGLAVGRLRRQHRLRLPPIKEFVDARERGAHPHQGLLRERTHPDEPAQQLGRPPGESRPCAGLGGAGAPSLLCLCDSLPVSRTPFLAFPVFSPCLLLSVLHSPQPAPPQSWRGYTERPLEAEAARLASSSQGAADSGLSHSLISPQCNWPGRAKHAA